MGGTLKMLEVTLPIMPEVGEAVVQRLRYDAIRDWFVQVAEQRVRAADHPLTSLWSLPMVDVEGRDVLHREWRALGPITTWPLAGYRLTYKRGGTVVTGEGDGVFTAGTAILATVGQPADPPDWDGPAGHFCVQLTQWLLHEYRVAGKTYTNKPLGATLRVDGIEF